MFQVYTADLPTSEQLLYRTGSAAVALLCVVWCSKVYSVLPEPYLVGNICPQDPHCLEAKGQYIG